MSRPPNVTLDIALSEDDVLRILSWFKRIGCGLAEDKDNELREYLTHFVSDEALEEV